MIFQKTRFYPKIFSKYTHFVFVFIVVSKYVSIFVSDFDFSL